MKDGFGKFTLLVAFFSILAQAALILTAVGTLPPTIPLFYSRPWGEVMLAPAIFVWILPTIAAGACIFNLALGKVLVLGKSFLIKTLETSTLIVALTTLYDTVKIISLLT